MAVQTCKAHGILKLLRQIVCGTNKHQVGGETGFLHISESDCNVFQIFCSSVSMVVVSESPWCWS